MKDEKMSKSLFDCLNEAGRELQARYGDEPIPREEIKRAAAALGSYKESSLIPSDYCYNRINADPASFQRCLFVWETSGLYRYVGENYPYTGAVIWKPQNSHERQVGEWKNGTPTLNHDPRK